MKQFILILSLSLFLVGCSTQTTQEEPTPNNNEVVEETGLLELILDELA